MATTHDLNSNPSSAATLYVALELGWSEWKLAFTTGVAQKPRLRTIPARDLHALELEIARAKDRFMLPADTAVIELLRGRPRWLLAPSLPGQQRHPEPHRRCGQHRGQSQEATCQDRPPRRRKLGCHAHPMASRRAEALEHRAASQSRG